MMFRVPRSAFRVLIAFSCLAGCVDQAAAPAPTDTGARAAEDASFERLVVIGNSITRMGPMAAVDWNGDRGMAASTTEQDFAHLAASALDLPLAATNFSTLERMPADASPFITTTVSTVTDATAVVIELGDNVADDDLAVFAGAYGELLQSVSHAARLVCVGTWWYRAGIDAVIRTACGDAGGTYLYIGDIRTSPGNTDRLDGPQYVNPFVQDHPHDGSMQVIADRVVDALRTSR